MLNKLCISFALLLCSTIGYAADQPPLPLQDGNVHEGVSTCAGSNCHGSVLAYQHSNILHNEYITWERKDPHSQSYKKMFGKEFADITNKLGMKPAYKEPACLVCHASYVPEKLRGKKFHVEDGIGCEACHGGSEKWLKTHTSKKATHKDNVEKGLYPNDNIVLRTRVCLSCHYGNKHQFVSHDIMGAGHPRISFEMDTYSALQPPHFVQDKDYSERKTAYSHVKVWAAGQAVAAEAMLKMLKSDHMKTGKLFPELSLFDCQSCHHSMAKKTWAPRRGTGLGPGVVTINDSSLLMLRNAAVPVDATLAWKLKTMIKEMHMASTEGYAALDEKVSEMQPVVNEIKEKILPHKFSANDIQKISLSLLNEGVWGECRNYVAAEQAVMAISALTVSWDKKAPFSDTRKTTIKREIKELYKILDDENNFDPKRFREALRMMRDTLSAN